MAEGRYDDPDLERRLENWQAWYSGESYNPQGYPSRSSCAEPSLTSGYREATVPVLAGEAFDTDLAIQTLRLEWQACIQMEYLKGPELTQGQRAQRLGYDSARTYNRRVDDAKQGLKVELQKRAQVRRRSHNHHGL